MVKFGRHLQFYLECKQSEGEHYVVPYMDIKDLIGESPAEDFVAEWGKCLRLASEDYVASTNGLWQIVFGALRNLPESRGARLDEALRQYAAVAGLPAAQDLLASARGIHSAAEVNTEALRKLVKKWDKHAQERDDHVLSPSLLPEAYASSFSAGLASLEVSIELLRQLTAVADDESGWEADEETSSDRSRQDEESVRRRADEFQWLKNMIASIPIGDLGKIVAHRGFHNPHGLSDVRPLENSLQAYEAAWTSGIHLCECDIAITKDEKLILAHDEDFSRLALHPTSDASKMKVQDMTFQQLISLTLKSGTRPPLLVDVLQSAQTIGEHAKLIIEIKPGNSEACTALARLFTRHPELVANVAVIISFDAFIVHSLRMELAELFLSEHNTTNLYSVPMLSSEPGYGSVGSYKQPSPLMARTREEKKFDHNVAVEVPKIMLLTVAEPPQHHCELWADVEDLTPVDGWLRHGDETLDGVYLQFQPKMLEPEGAAALRSLSEKYQVGIWGLLGRDPDDYNTLHSLVKDCGVSFYNTDLPRSFFRKRALQEPYESGTASRTYF